MNIQEFKKELETQDNRATENPLYVIYEYQKLPTDSNYSDEWEYADEDDGYNSIGNTYEELINYVKTNYPDFYEEIYKKFDYAEQDDIIEDFILCSDKIPIKKFYYYEVKKFVTACFTEKSAKEFIEQNRHNLTKPFIYVETLNRNKEMIDIINYFRKLK
ncbi:MAG TPA: hypothetical protein VMZ91_13410 [Candidatus Paceibacterota bacterium]|nr:hypothetical protein [Candidatus Paceibacterota bacterium]